MDGLEAIFQKTIPISSTLSYIGAKSALNTIGKVRLSWNSPQTVIRSQLYYSLAINRR